MKKIIKNFLFNLIASILPIVFLQLLTYPLMAKILDIDHYGKMLIFISVTNIIIQISGIGINNARIINGDNERVLNGDFAFLSIILSILNTFLCIIATYIIDNNIKLYDLILLIFMVVFGFLKIYYSAEYSLNKNFKKILISNIWMLIGYGIGGLFFLKTHNWIYIFFIGNLISFVYVLKTTKIWKEKACISNRFKDIAFNTFTISFSSLLINLVTYADRILLFPIVGSSQVAIYYTASVFGKILSMGLSPISSVLLSYFSKDFNMDNKKFWKMNFVNFMICISFYFIAYYLSEPIIKILYPDLFSQVKNIINIANLTAIINASTILLQPTILRYCNLQWQIFIQIIHLFIYCICTSIFVPMYGILGFAYISLFITIIKLIFLLLIGSITFKEKTE